VINANPKCNHEHNVRELDELLSNVSARIGKVMLFSNSFCKP